MTGIPAWVAAAVETRTGLDPRLGRSARATTCRQCRAPVLRGLDADMCAFHVTTDPQRLTAAGELLAVLTGRDTFTLTGRPPELTFRDRYRIRRDPPDRAVVVPEHQCGAPELPAYPDPPAQKTPAVKGGTNVPPF